MQAKNTPPEQSSMTLKDRLTLVLSVLALLVSGLSLYLSQRASYRVEAVVLASDALGGDLTYQLAILNQGTRRIIVTEARLSQETQDNALSVSNPLARVRMSPTLPAIVEPRDVLLISFDGPLSLPDLYARGDPPDPGEGNAEFDGQPTRKVRMVVDVRAIDFRGKPSDVRLGVGDLHITPASVAIAGPPDPALAFFKNP